MLPVDLLHPPVLFDAHTLFKEGVVLHLVEVPVVGIKTYLGHLWFVLVLDRAVWPKHLFLLLFNPLVDDQTLDARLHITDRILVPIPFGLTL